jgi:hypothetical protein
MATGNGMPDIDAAAKAAAQRVVDETNKVLEDNNILANELEKAREALRINQESLMTTVGIVDQQGERIAAQRENTKQRMARIGITLAVALIAVGLAIIYPASYSTIAPAQQHASLASVTPGFQKGPVVLTLT